jgi:hypothetical protein
LRGSLGRAEDEVWKMMKVERVGMVFAVVHAIGYMRYFICCAFRAPSAPRLGRMTRYEKKIEIGWRIILRFGKARARSVMGPGRRLREEGDKCGFGSCCGHSH